jgi:hypothetical protein
MKRAAGYYGATADTPLASPTLPGTTVMLVLVCFPDCKFLMA